MFLFLAHDEIAGGTSVVSEVVGVAHTPTNPAHRPKMLVNDPRIAGHKVLRCALMHHGAYLHCLRSADTQSNSDAARQ